MLKLLSFFMRYTLLAIALITSPLGWFFLACALGAMALKNAMRIYCFNVLHCADVLIAGIVFGTKRRTISGITGERAAYGRRGWRRMARVIDALALFFGDDENHCFNAYVDEVLAFEIEGV